MGRDLKAGWRVVGASVAGQAHRRRDQPCADACATRVLRLAGGGSLFAAVVADGAGCASSAAEGAELACLAICDVLAGWTSRNAALGTLADETARDWIDHVRERIEGLATLELSPVEDYATTLLVALVDDEQAVFLQLGDGAMVYRDPCGRLAPAIWPQRGEYANETSFITDPLAAERMQIARVAGVRELALLSDGLQSLALDFSAGEAYAPFFDPMLRELRTCSEARLARLQRELSCFLDGDAVNRRTDDDKTLVLAIRRERAA